MAYDPTIADQAGLLYVDAALTGVTVGDGVHYSRALGWQSPEGNMYGQTRFVRDWRAAVVWTGSEYLPVDAAGQAESAAGLPSGPRPAWEIWATPRPNWPPANLTAYDGRALDYYYWDAESEGWKELQWLYEIEDVDALPFPGLAVGAAHVVLFHDVQVFWDGYAWRRFRHSTIEDDQPGAHLPPGFIEMLTPDVRLVWQSKRELALQAVDGGAGTVMVGGERIAADPRCSVFSHLPALEWDVETGSVQPHYIDPNTDYWVYLAGRDDESFSADALPGDDDHNATPEWNFAGRLFLSRTDPVNEYLSDEGAGLKARLMGRIQTDSMPAADGGPQFQHNLDISWISRRPSLPEAFRDYSDFVLRFVDEETLRLDRIEGRWGQIYIPQELYHLGDGRDLSITDPWIQVGDDESLTWRDSDLMPGARYYVYVANDVDAFNFNGVNPLTNRPWRMEDEGSAGNYDAELDLRLKLFLSPAAPEYGKLTQSWPGYWTRHIGTVQVDENGFFVYGSDLSAVGPPAVQARYLDGLAELQIWRLDETEFRIAAQQGTSGTVMVSGQPVQAYDRLDTQVHKAKSTDPVYSYTESQIDDPLTAGDAVQEYPATRLYYYLANDEEHWGDLAGRGFFCDQAPTNGYLSRNWPGSTARWIATIITDTAGKFTGSFIEDGIAGNVLRIDDGSTSYNVLWSAGRIAAEFAAVRAEMSAGALYESQKSLGLAVQLTYLDSTQIRLSAITPPATIAFPDSSTREIGTAGVDLTVTGATGTLYYVYLESDTFYLSTDAPTDEFEKMSVRGNAILVGYLGLSATDAIAAAWNIYSFYHEPDREWGVPVEKGVTAVLSLPGLIVPPGGSAQIDRSGATYVYGYCVNYPMYNCYTPACVFGWQSCGSGIITVYCSCSLSREQEIGPGVYYADITLTQEKWGSGVGCNAATIWADATGDLHVARPGNA